MTEITQTCFGLVDMTPVIIKDTTEREALVDVGMEGPVWLALAHVDLIPNPDCRTHTLSIPEWLAKDKGLI